MRYQTYHWVTAPSVAEMTTYHNIMKCQISPNVSKRFSRNFQGF